MKKCPKCGTEYTDTTTLCPSDGVALETTSDARLGQTLAGKYRLEERLNEGGMGTVYRGTHVLMDKTVAVKVLRPSLAADEKIVARFSREARAASRISHPHALSVTDFGESEDGVVFIVMEYLSGSTLKEIIRHEGPMPLSRVGEILRQVGSALEAAHEQGVVHRDLKSENIMLLSTNGPDYAKVLDFGIAKIIEPDGTYNPGLTSPDLVIGTPQYMSPEQCSQSQDIDARSDIYSLGVIAYEMLVGKVPFTGESPTAIMMKHLQEPSPSVLEQRPDVPSAIGRVVTRAMAKRPDDRYLSVGEMVEEFTVAAGQEPNATPATAPTTGPNRIVVPTKAVVTTVRGVVEDDETTMVRPRVNTSPGVAPAVTGSVRTVRPTSFNPWKILIPSLAGLLVVFAVVYAFSGNSNTANTNQTEPALVTDPNSRPVEPSPPATGTAEVGIISGGAATNQIVNANENANANANANANSDVAPTPEDVNANANAQAADNSNRNANADPPAATPPLPTPIRQLNTNNQVPAPPSGTKVAEPKPTTPRPAESPTPAG